MNVSLTLIFPFCIKTLKLKVTVSWDKIAPLEINLQWYSTAKTASLFYMFSNRNCFLGMLPYDNYHLQVVKIGWCLTYLKKLKNLGDFSLKIMVLTSI